MGDSIQAGDQLLLKYGLENLPLGVNGPSYFSTAKKFATAVEVVCAPDRDAAADKVVSEAKAVDTHFRTVFRNTHPAQGAKSLTISPRLAALKQARTEFIKAKSLLKETLKNQTDLKAITTARNKVKQAEVNFVILLRSGPSPLNNARADLIEARSNLKATLELKKNPQAAFMDRLTELCNLLPTLSEKVEETGSMHTIAGYAKNLTFVMPFGLALAIPLVAAPVLGIMARSCFFTRNFIYATDATLGVTYSKERSSLHNKVWDGIRLFSATQLLLGTALDLLKTLSGLGPAVFGSLSGYGFATYIYIYAAQEGHYAYRAWRKSWDIDYFIAERKEALVAEIKLLVDRRTWLDHLYAKVPIASANNQLEKSREKIEVMEKQVVALTFYKQEEANRKSLENTKSSYIEPMDAESKQNRAIAHVLISKEKEKKENHRVKFLTFLAVGAVITTATAMVLPELVVLGIVILSIIAALLKVAQRVNSDYSVEAIHAVVAKRQGKNHRLNEEAIKEKLLTKAIRSTLAEKFQTRNEVYEKKAIAAIKAALSQKHKEQLIQAQARVEYNPSAYLNTKVKSAHEGASRIGSACCSFFATIQDEPDLILSPINVNDSQILQ